MPLEPEYIANLAESASHIAQLVDAELSFVVPSFYGKNFLAGRRTFEQDDATGEVREAVVEAYWDVVAVDDWIVAATDQAAFLAAGVLDLIDEVEALRADLVEMARANQELRRKLEGLSPLETDDR